VIANSPLAREEILSNELHLTNDLRVSSNGQNLSEVHKEEHTGSLLLVLRVVFANFATAITSRCRYLKTCYAFCSSG
jgi:hypothetical protein